jgi:hypothetical protein
LLTSASTALNNANLNAQIKTLTDGIKINFYPSSFIINDKKWLIENKGELSIRKHFIGINELKISNNQQQIAISSQLDDVTNQTSIKGDLNNINLEDFVPFLFKDPQLSGALTGTLTINDPFGKISADFIGRTDSLRIEHKYIGNINMNAIGNTETGLIEFHAKSNDTSNDFSVNGNYNYKDSGDHQLEATLLGEKINLSIIQPYLTDVFNEIEGDAVTNLKISGSPEHKYITGNVLIQKGSFKVAFTQCRYLIENQTLKFEKDKINLNYIKIKDTLNNTASLSGSIYHNLFDNFRFDNVGMETAKLSLLNTTKKDFSQFYGDAIGKGKINLAGPLSNLKLIIDCEPMQVDSSHLFLNTSEEKESNAIDYIDFVQYGKKMEESKFSSDINFVAVVNVKANPTCKVDVILDEETGDIIHGQGNGNISVKFGNKENLEIRGLYELTKGEYTFNFQTYFKRPFELNNGTISWTGDPYNAIINIDAGYLAKNVDLNSLSSTGGFKQKEDIKIIAHLTGLLQSPNIKFEFLLPEKSDAKRDDIIVKRLADFKSDDNEMNKQVASLLLFNTFIIGNQNFLTQGNASSLITNTIGGIMSNLLTNFFNRELEKATKGMISTYIDINPTLDLQKNTSMLQANIRAGLKILLNNRLIVLVGGNLDYNNPTYTQQLEKKGLITPDITVEWLINKDGTLRVVGFNRSSIDFTLNQRNRSGLQLSYRKDMNRISRYL